MFCHNLATGDLSKAICGAVSWLLLLATPGLPPLTAQVVDPSPADSVVKLIPRDGDPVGDRIPLIFIHGLTGNQVGREDSIASPNLSVWEPLAARLRAADREGLLRRFKVYQFHYESHRHSTWELGRALRNALDRETLADPGFDREIVIIAHSMGGLVARQYMNEHSHNVGQFAGRRGGERVRLLVTLGTPHLGSPFANGPSRNQVALAADLADGNPVDGWSAAIAAASTLVHTSVDYQGGLRFDFEHISWWEPNRNDLRWDNQSLPFFPDNQIDAENRDLNTLNRGEQYAHRLVAYYGTLTETDPDYAAWLRRLFPLGAGAGPRSPAGVLVAAGLTGNMRDQLVVASLILGHGLRSREAKPFLANDGVVPVLSAAFSTKQIRRMRCENYTHEELRTGEGGRSCENGLTLAESLLGRLREAAELAGDGPVLSRVEDLVDGTDSGIAPGQIVALLGSSFGPAERAQAEMTASSVPVELSGVRALFGDQPGGVLAAAPDRIIAIAPYEIARSDAVEVRVEVNGILSEGRRVPVASANPRILVAPPGDWLARQEPAGHALAWNDRGARVSIASPAAPNSVVGIAVTGMGPLAGERDGNRIARDFQTVSPVLPVSVTIGGLPADLVRVQTIPSQPAAVLMLVVRVPSRLSGGNHPVIVRAGNAASQPGVFLSVAGSDPALSLADVSLEPASVVGGGSGRAIIRLSRPVRTGETAQIRLRWDLPGIVFFGDGPLSSATLDLNLTAGASQAEVPFMTRGVLQSRTVNVSASLGSQLITRQLSITQGQAGLYLSQSSVVGGGSVQATLRLSGTAGFGGRFGSPVEISISSSHSAVRVPSLAILGPGDSAITFTVSTQTVSANLQAVITARHPDLGEATARLTVSPPGGGSGISVQDKVFEIAGTFRIGNQTVGLQIQAVPDTYDPSGRSHYIVISNGGDFLRYPQFIVGITATGQVAGSTVTFDGSVLASAPGYYQSSPLSIEMVSRVTLTITFTALRAGADVSGKIRFVTSGGVREGEFTGRITGIG